MTKHHKTGSTATLHDKLKTDEETMMSEGSVDVSDDQLSLLSYNELLEACKKAQKENSGAQDRLLRQQAEMNNMQKRSERDVIDAHKYALTKFINELLPIVDSLERAVNLPEDQQHSVVEGVSLTLEMFINTLKKFGVEQIDPIMQPFNPEEHQAVSTIEDSEVQPGTVLNVLQKGYLLNGRLVRPALVIVSKAS